LSNRAGRTPCSGRAYRRVRLRPRRRTHVSGQLAGEEIVQPDQNPLPTSFGFASGNGAAFATFRTIPATTATVLTVPLKGGSISPIIVATGVCPGCMLNHA
jgi:uncharacterized protein (DUF2062 family)